MLPSRFTAGMTSNMKRPSFLPKPRRPGSTDRASVDARRPSNIRSSSAEPPRITFAGTRLSREASATKIPANRRSRSQQSEVDRHQYGQHVPMTPMTPVRHSRPTATPRTPSEDRASRGWQASVDRALACVTVKDNRPIQSAAWQRAMMSRVQEALGSLSPNSNTTLLRPLTITRFVDITGSLLHTLTKDAKLNNDNYILRLPHTAKRLLYPGTVSKSWLRTVNTLHAFPQALALIAYFTDLVTIIETPVYEEELYVAKDEMACLRREYLYKCWIKFQEPEPQYEDINEDYIQQLKGLLGDDEEKITELQQIVDELQLYLDDEAEVAARAAEARRGEVRAALLAALRAERAGREGTRGARRDAETRARSLADLLQARDLDIERAAAESQQLREDLERQPMSVAERTKLLEEVDYANRVIDSKRLLAEQIAKMVSNKETELMLWQKRTLDSCVEYKQGLIHLSATWPEVARLSVDEKELMESECASRVAAALEPLRTRHADLLQRSSARERERHADRRARAVAVADVGQQLRDVAAAVEREQAAAEEERARAAAALAEAERARAGAERRARETEQQVAAADMLLAERQHWERQYHAWTSKLKEFRAYVTSQREAASQKLEEKRQKRATLVLDTVANWHRKLEQKSA